MQTRITEAQAKELRERYDALCNIRSPWIPFWGEIAKYISPARAPGMSGTIMLPGTTEESRLFDTTMQESVKILANGCVAWMSPQEAPWSAYVVDESATPDSEVKKFLNRCTAATRENLARSNFYTAVHEFYLDRSGYGTGCLYVEPGKKRKINAQCWSIGTYVIDEDDEGEVDTVIREMAMTPRTAAMKFGIENLSEAVRKKVEKGGAEAVERLNYLHFIYPRPEDERVKGSIAPEDMPIACVYMEKDSRHIARVSGYDEMPVMVSRYLEWGSNMGLRYGWSPSASALPESRQLNYLQKMMDALAERAAFPSVLAPEELEGEIDPNAGMPTYFSADIAQRLPREWLTGGRYDVGKDRIIERQNAIKTAFHVDLFQMFSQIDKQMTAREVAERSSEKLIQFSPTFARLTTELFNPLLERLFGMGLRDGWFGPAPESMIQDIGNELGYVPPPQVQYSSRIALALRSLPVIALHRAVELLGSIVPLQGAGAPIMDVIDWDAALRMVLQNESMPEGIERPEQEVQALRQARAEAAAQQQQMEQAAATADAAAKVGRVPNDSPVGRAIGQTLDQAA